MLPAQSRETLETQVTASRGSVTFEWTKKHLLDAQLQGTPPILVAEYRNADGRTVLDCLSGQSGGRMVGCTGAQRLGTPSNRSLRYVLPDQLTGNPTGPVCLLLQMPNGRPLPVRRADQDRGETARFRYVEWEAIATKRSALAAQQANVARLRESVKNLEAAVVAQQAANEKSGGNDAASCNNGITARTSVVGGAQRPAIDLNQLPALAARVCVARVWIYDSLFAAKRVTLAERLADEDDNIAFSPSTLDELMGWLSPVARQRLLQFRGAELATYKSDWNTHAPHIAAYRSELRRQHLEPEFGGFNEELRIQSDAKAAAMRIAKAAASRQPIDSTLIAGVVGSNLEAFVRCKSDGMSQMRRTAENDAKLAASESTTMATVGQALVEKCVAGIERLTQLQAQLTTRRRELEEAERALAAMATDVARGALEHKPRELNSEACRPGG